MVTYTALTSSQSALPDPTTAPVPCLLAPDFDDPIPCRSHPKPLLYLPTGPQPNPNPTPTPTSTLLPPSPSLLQIFASLSNVSPPPIPSGSLFMDYQARSTKPLLLSEYGADSYSSHLGREDQATQAGEVAAMAQAVADNAAASGGVAAGGMVFEWAGPAPPNPTQPHPNPPSHPTRSYPTSPHPNRPGPPPPSPEPLHAIRSDLTSPDPIR